MKVSGFCLDFPQLEFEPFEIVLVLDLVAIQNFHGIDGHITLAIIGSDQADESLGLKFV